MAEFEYQSAGATEAVQKQALAYLFEQTSVGLATTGTLTGLAVTQTTTASDSVVIAAGASVVQASVLVGASLLVNNTDKTLEVLTTNPVGGLPRNDIVAFDTLTDAIIAIIGTPNASPTDPTVPTTSVALARLRHAASATTIPTANIDDLRSYTVLAGVTSSAHLLYTPPSNLDTPTSGSATWMTLGSVTVPAWATRCYVTYTINGVYEPVIGGNVRARLKVGTAAGAVDKRILAPGVANQRFHVPVTDVVTGLTAGSQSVTILATFAATGVVRADTNSFVTASFTFEA